MSGSFVLGVDLDGVCADYTTAFRAVVAADRGVDAESLPYDRGWDFGEWDLAPGDFDRLHHIAILEHRMFRTMPVMAGAAEALWRLSDAGVWIRIITHRLCVNWGHQVTVADTVQWLDDAAIPYRDICFLGTKPEVEAGCYIDDGPHNIDALRAAGNDVIVFDAPYNRHLPGPRAASWADVEDIVAGIVLDHGGVLQGQLSGLDPPAARLQARLRPAGSEAGPPA
jgi:5'(3')-deoxyribonucleotidase